MAAAAKWDTGDVFSITPCCLLSKWCIVRIAFSSRSAIGCAPSPSLTMYRTNNGFHDDKQPLVVFILVFEISRAGLSLDVSFITTLTKHFQIYITLPEISESVRWFFIWFYGVSLWFVFLHFIRHSLISYLVLTNVVLTFFVYITFDFENCSEKIEMTVINANTHTHTLHFAAFRIFGNANEQVCHK